MVWVPTKGQRARVRARFADLTKESEHVSTASSFNKTQNAQTTAHPADRATIGASTFGTLHNTVSVEVSAESAGGDLRINIPGAKTRSSPEEDVYDRHHIPPRHPRKYIIKRVKRSHHEAFNLLFGSSGSLEECVAILKEHWWPNSP